MNVMSKEEVDEMIKDYQNGMRVYLLVKKYNRDSSTIISRLRKAGVFVPANTRYSEEDVNIIATLYKDKNWDKIFELYPNSTKQAITSLMSKNKIAFGNRWSDEDIAIIKENYYKYSLEELERMVGYRHNCSSIQTYAVSHFGYSTSRLYTEEENQIFVKYYPVVSIDEMQKLLPKRAKSSIIEHARQLGLKSCHTLKLRWNKEQINLLIDNWENMTDVELSELIGRDVRSIQEKRHQLDFYRIDKTHGKYENLKKFFRGCLNDWKEKSMKNSNYQCIITGSKDFQIHHLIPFNQIVSNMFKHNNLEEKELEEYSVKELDELIDLFRQEHDNYPLGICVRKDIHDLYHKTYGKYTNTPEEWDRFVDDYKLGKYNSLITV